MGFGYPGGGSYALNAASDVAFSNPANGQSVVYNGTLDKWMNVTVSGGVPTLANIPAGSTITVAKAGGVWPARPTSRSDIIVHWKGPDPSPSIVSSGTGGMLDNVDMRFVTP